jgi:hypothetical protein
MIMKTEIDTYLQAIKNDYAATGNGSPIRTRMIQEFCEALTTAEGNKYIKVILGPQRSVHSFIVKHDGPKFKRGDILKAASWNAPALNFKRGNVLTGDFNNVRWTGV